MQFHVVTLFPEQIDTGLNSSIIKKARENEHIGLHLINIRDFANNKHKRVDDYPFGGGAGMVMQAEPVYEAYKSLVVKENTKVIYLTPQGKTLTQKRVEELAKEEELVLICGHYEGIDERVIEEIVTDEISIGDYILTGGEMAAMILIDAVSRHVEGVLSNKESVDVESFDDNLLEYPQYTRPRVWKEKEVPAVLLSGNHKKIEEFRYEQALKRTKEKRPDLLEKRGISENDKKILG